MERQPRAIAADRLLAFQPSPTQCQLTRHAGLLVFPYALGTFVIVPITTGWEVRFEDEALGNYTFAEAALANLLSGRCAPPTNGIDPSSAGLPQRLSEWTFVRR